MSQAWTTSAPKLNPQFCFNETLLRDFLRISRSTIDDSITQNLNALYTPARAGFDPSSTAIRQTDSAAGKQIDPTACQGFKENVLFPSWQVRSDVLNYCAGVATSADPEDPVHLLRQTESVKERERIVDERLDPYSAQSSTQTNVSVVDERLDPYSARAQFNEARTESLANLVRTQRGVEEIIRARTWGMVSERCGGSSEGWEEALNTWRESRQSK
ncbi:hypothetical protein BO71DRAFT_394673 [Aspergillus ellipticus CBS 707.79]|uniref:Caffeine-induced death protein Cid2 n=1 Tax=Aspergillus ellipticus CBS 707.79 TaxID=1448320 RepID=A0A319DNU3_9EURO|nr:hypothetical protein BO71DRAFT_394673 [Aspergillus ellipticus CBS 707.79]